MPPLPPNEAKKTGTFIGAEALPTACCCLLQEGEVSEEERWRRPSPSQRGWWHTHEAICREGIESRPAGEDVAGAS